MLSWFRHLFLPAIVLSSALRAAAQLPMPDKVCVGAGRSYWVDSTVNPGSIYSWAIDGTVVQSGITCSFAHTWNFEGTFELTIRQITASGCVGKINTGQVIVIPAAVPDWDFRIFPNPLFGPDLKSQLTLPLGSVVSIDLFTSNGQLINRIFEGYLSGGVSKTITYIHNLPQGIYLYQVRTEKQIINRRIIVIREY